MTRRTLALLVPLLTVLLAACGGSATTTTTVTQTVTTPGPTVTATQTVTATSQQTTPSPDTSSDATQDNTAAVNQVIDQFHCDTVYAGIDYTLQVSDAQKFWDCKWLESDPQGEVMVADFGSDGMAAQRYNLLTQKGMFAMRRGSVVVLGQTRADIATAKARWK